MNTLFIGIDEAGRGPWAGPLVVAGLALFDAKILSEISLLNDSKKLSEKNREKIFNELQNLKNAQKLDFCIVEKSAEIIDEKGIREANRQAMGEIIENILEKFVTQNQNIDELEICVLIDGSDNFRFQELEEKHVCEYFFARKKSRKNPEANQEPFFPKSFFKAKNRDSVSHWWRCFRKNYFRGVYSCQSDKRFYYEAMF